LILTELKSCLIQFTHTKQRRTNKKKSAFPCEIIGKASSWSSHKQPILSAKELRTSGEGGYPGLDGMNPSLQLRDSAGLPSFNLRAPASPWRSVLPGNRPPSPIIDCCTQYIPVRRPGQANRVGDRVVLSVFAPKQALSIDYFRALREYRPISCNRQGLVRAPYDNYESD
jgi:hypothetical protein